MYIVIINALSISQNMVSGEVVVNIREDGARYRRSADGVTVPAKNMEIVFTLNESLVDLHLKRNEEISANVPIYTMNRQGTVEAEHIQERNVRFIQKFMYSIFYIYELYSHDKLSMFWTIY